MSDPCWNGGQISYWHFYMRSSIVLYVAMSLAMATVIANIAHDVYHHLWRDADRTRVLMSSLRGLGWARGIFLFVRRRFDWFTGRAGDGPTNEERMNGRQRMVLVALSSLCAFAKCSLVYNIFVQQMKCTHPS
ncbi:uncharacterized protein EDB91DRAFT_1156396 [Suillus paluster]|uniref:uncharacterized protein n=1 Tax=Suillus paluster TaxID=48578 RepID=UPI001B86D53F|nr:uncharacterized protein EDB91DRAFT_1156396 [Suillus paluster]KAG1730869.1 hypothetical protein EDB91DRAFT_1156396 [Suillus paluster]